jgi:hypothetical protein
VQRLCGMQRPLLLPLSSCWGAPPPRFVHRLCKNPPLCAESVKKESPPLSHAERLHRTMELLL